MALDLVLMMLNSIGRDVGRRRFRLVVCLAVVCALLTGCSAEPMTAREATTWLRQTFEGKFRLKLQEAGTTREGRPQQIYWYTDQDGRQFWVKSSVVTNSLLGWLEEATITNYLSVWYESRMAELSSILGSYDVDFDGGDIYITITVTTQCEYRDLDPLSEAVARAMNAVKSPLKTDNYISMPKIDINCEGGAGVAGKTIFLGGWDLPLVGGRVDAESLLARFQWNYVNGVRRGNIDEVLPDEAYEAVPPPEFDLMLGQEQIATFELMNSLDDYYTDDLALTTMDAQSGSSYAKRLPTFVNLIALLGGTYTDHGCDCVVGADRWHAETTWTIGGQVWVATEQQIDHGLDTRGRQTPIEHTLAVTKDGQPVEIAAVSEKDRAHLVIPGWAFSVEDVAVFLGVEIEVDYVTSKATIVV